MAKSVQAICKNTFISIIAEGDDSMPTSMRPSPRLPVRSRSAECARSRPEAEEFQEVSQQSLQRLNAVLTVGISSPRQAPQKEHPEAGAEFMLDQADSHQEDVECLGSGLSQLRTLQGKLAKALAGNAGSLQKPWDNKMRVSSSCSLSTMAPDDASDCGEPSISGGGLRRMPKVWSSGSVSTMVSDFNDCFDEDGEVEFELDIEAGAAAALDQRPLAASEQMSGAAVASRGPGAVSPEMSHSLVPRNQNMAEMYDSKKHEPPTTMMIRNIPGRYSQNDLMMDLQDLGLGSAYDFLYIPMDKSTAANVGYAFVNFIDAYWAEKCVECFQNYRFNRHQRSSTKVASVSVAHLQGLEKNMQHYENAAVNMARDKRRRPVVVPNIAKMFR